MRGPKQLLDCEDKWVTEMGAWIAGERVVCRGRNIFSEYNNKRWMELFLYGITGKDFSESEILLFEQIWVICSSYPDSRIWNNRVATLAGTAKSTPSMGVAGSIAVTDAKILGVSPVSRSMEFLCRAKMLRDQGLDLREIALGAVDPLGHLTQCQPELCAPIAQHRTESVDPVPGNCKSLSLIQHACTFAPVQLSVLCADFWRNHTMTLQSVLQIMNACYNSLYCEHATRDVQAPLTQF